MRFDVYGNRDCFHEKPVRIRFARAEDRSTVLNQSIRALYVASFALMLATLFGWASGKAANAPVPDTSVRDLPYLTSILESAHPNLFFTVRRSDFNRMAAAADQRLKNDPHADAFSIIAPLVSTIGDLHTSVSPFTEGYLAVRNNGERLFPFEVYRHGDKTVIYRMYGKPDPGLVGTEIVQISGKPIRSIWTALRRNVSGEREPARDYVVSDNIRALLWHAGIRAPYRLGFIDRSGHRFDRTISGCALSDIHAWDKTVAGAAYAAPLAFRSDDAHRFALLRIHSFDGSLEKEIDGQLAYVLKTLQDQKIRTLVIDVRNNSGGSTVLSDHLMKLFAQQPFLTFSAADTKISSAIRMLLGRDEYTKRFGADAWTATDGTILHETYSTYDFPNSRDARFNGRTFILIGSGTFSTAAIFAATAQDSKNATILGQESGGLPSLYGEVVSFTLPNSKLAIGVSTKYFVRASRDRSQRGVVPDHALEETPEGQPDTEQKAANAFATR